MFSPAGNIPIYSALSKLDLCNFADNTIWEKETSKYSMDSLGLSDKSGSFILSEATDIDRHTDAKYDALLSCHSLEHTANPMKALLAWGKVLKRDGVLLLVLPEARSSFDQGRAVTTIEHLMDDFTNNIGEDDETHFPDILENYNLDLDPWVNSREELEDLLRRNIDVRGAHHHVFDLPLSHTMLEKAKFSVLHSEVILQSHIVLVARKSD